MKPAPFAYMRPPTVAAACLALRKYGEDARIIAGGQSLAAMLNMRIVTPRVLIDINCLESLSNIVEDGDAIVVGATVKQADTMAHTSIRRHVPLLQQALPYVGHYQTRSRGTICGSVAHADPSAEIPLVLAVLGGDIELQSSKGKRRLAAKDYFCSALVTKRREDEIVMGVRWPKAQIGARFGFAEFAVRGGDYAIVAVACAADADAAGHISSMQLGFGGCGDAPQVVKLDRRQSGLLDADEAMSLAHTAASRIACRSDLQGSADYRRQLAATLCSDVLRSTAASAQVLR